MSIKSPIRLSRTVIVLVAVGSILGGATGVVLAQSDLFKSTQPTDWIDSGTGSIDPSRVPDRLKFSTELTPSGFGWIDKNYVVMTGDRLEIPEQPMPIYAGKSGSEIVGYFDTESGMTLDSEQRPLDGQLPRPVSNGG